MAKRIIIVSSFHICIISAVIALIFVGTGWGETETSISIDYARTQLIETANADKAAEADAAIDKFTADYARNSELPSNLVAIADSFAWKRLYSQADRLYRLSMDLSPNNTSLASKARLGLARIDILNLINQKKYSEARELVNDLTRDFRNEPDAGVALFQIGQEFGWQRRYVESKEAFDHLINDFPNSSPSQEAKLWSERAGICALIGKVKDEDIVTAIDKLMSDFEGDSRLPDTLFWIGREYEWTKGAGNNRNGWYDTPNNVYQRLVQQFNFGQADWDYKRLNHRMKIFKLIKESNESETNAAIEKMVSEFAGRPELAGELFWIACGYEEVPEKEHLAKQMYERIVKECPDSAEANNAVLDIRRLAIWEAVKANDVNKAKTMTDIFIADFKLHPYGSDCLGRVGISAYKKGLVLKNENKPEQARQYFDRAGDIWQRIKENVLQDGKDSKYLYYYAACTYNELKRWEESIEYFQKIAENYDDSLYGYKARLGICLGYEAMCDSNIVKKSEINLLLEQVYKELLTKYPTHPSNYDILIKLGWINFNQGKIAEAISYFEEGLKTYPAGGKPADALYAVGSYYQKNEQPEKAIKAYEELLNSLPFGDPMVEIVKQKLLQVTLSIPQ